VAFVCFCFASSAVYLFNDVRDRGEDRAHPVKRLRPIAAGRLAPGVALGAALGLAAAALAIAHAKAAVSGDLVAVFLGVNLLYSLGLKRVAVVDVIAIALGFVLRVQAGIDAIGAPQSAWILLCMFFIALFLATGKRRAEAGERREGVGQRRKVLDGYSIRVLDLMLALSATTAVVCYSLYAVTVQPREAFLVTILPVVFGIVRYAAIVLDGAAGEDPSEVLVSDGPLVAAILVWAALCVVVLYLGAAATPAGVGG
jgi:4-hydroxybenzoate polyprenyltransferase